MLGFNQRRCCIWLTNSTVLLILFLLQIFSKRNISISQFELLIFLPRWPWLLSFTVVAPLYALFIAIYLHLLLFSTSKTVNVCAPNFRQLLWLLFTTHIGAIFLLLLLLLQLLMFPLTFSESLFNCTFYLLNFVLFLFFHSSAQLCSFTRPVYVLVHRKFCVELNSFFARFNLSTLWAYLQTHAPILSMMIPPEKTNEWKCLLPLTCVVLHSFFSSLLICLVHRQFA